MLLKLTWTVVYKLCPVVEKAAQCNETGIASVF